MYIGHFDFAVKLIWTVEGLMSGSECAALLASHAEDPWLPATINGATGRVVEAQVRSNTTAIIRDPALGAELYARLLPHLPHSMIDNLGGSPRRVRPVGLYMPLRIYRYEPGQHFGLHLDQAYQDKEGRRSLLTFMVYLNEGFEGGTTTFPEQQQIIAPRTGMALLFQHKLLHSGERVITGTKYVIRSDVLFAEEESS